jgi:hypothetical protein
VPIVAVCGMCNSGSGPCWGRFSGAGGVVTADSAYLFCGLGAFQGSGEGRPSGGLLLLKRLSPVRMRTLSADINLETAVAARQRPGCGDSTGAEQSAGHP